MENDPKPYKFMKESIKKQPPDWKKIVLLIAGWLVLAALGGLVAAAVFAVTEPKIAGAITKEEPPAKVDIPGDEDPNSGQEMADRRCGRHWTGLFQRKMQWRELWQKKCISGDFWIMKDWCVKKTVRSE